MPIFSFPKFRNINSRYYKYLGCRFQCFRFCLTNTVGFGARTLGYVFADSPFSLKTCKLIMHLMCSCSVQTVNQHMAKHGRNCKSVITAVGQLKWWNFRGSLCWKGLDAISDLSIATFQVFWKMLTCNFFVLCVSIYLLCSLWAKKELRLRTRPASTLSRGFIFMSNSLSNLGVQCSRIFLWQGWKLVKIRHITAKAIATFQKYCKYIVFIEAFTWAFLWLFDVNLSSWFMRRMYTSWWKIFWKTFISLNQRIAQVLNSSFGL